MRISDASSVWRNLLVAVAFCAAAVPAATGQETASDAALALAEPLGGAVGGVSHADLLGALEDAAEVGQPLALWRLGLMYENGEGVERDPARAFAYFSRIANDYAETPPRALDADIVAQSFIKVGDYYQTGLPDAGITADRGRARALLLHAASFFGDPDAQYRVGLLYLDTENAGNPVQAARWLNLSARKGHAPAQATLGDLLFNGEGIARQPVEGLMWLTVASRRAAGTTNIGWIDDLLNGAMSIAMPFERQEAVAAADALSPMFGGIN